MAEQNVSFQRLLGAIKVPSTDWMYSAACKDADPRLFYPENGRNDQAREAKKICRECPVQLQCRRFALESGEKWGVWGGQSEKERRRVLRRIA